MPERSWSRQVRGSKLIFRTIVSNFLDNVPEQVLAAELQRNGYTHLKRIGDVLVGLQEYCWTYGLVVDLGMFGYGRRYCYESFPAALAALSEYSNTDVHPSGPWIKCKGLGIDLLNPEFCKP